MWAGEFVEVSNLLPSPGPLVRRSLTSALSFPDIVDADLKELALGYILGPYSALPDFPKFRVSPLGVVPKKSPGKYSVIQHLSYPEGNSVNDFIPHEFSSVQYATIQDVIACSH